MTEALIQSAFQKAAIIVALGLSALFCLAVYSRSRWPTLAVRVSTSLGMVLAFLASPGLVYLVAGPSQRLAWFVGIYFHPGFLLRFGPAVIAGLVGAAFYGFLARRRGQRVSVA